MPPAVVHEPYTRDLEFRGTITGSTAKDAQTGKALCHIFKGIPYAQPPVAEYRWQRPRELAPCYRYGTASFPGVFNDKCEVCPQLGAATPDKSDEDCLQCNIWVPAGQPPREGWPVYFFIHGGFLQLGNPNSGDPARFISEILPCIIVKPGYRLNVFGFLASSDVSGNFGFWDLRLALEWVYKNISYFSGNPRNITVGGYSAGAHAAFHQLAYDLWQPKAKQLIRRLVMHSNGAGVQPKSRTEIEVQFNELLSILDIPRDVPDRMDFLRRKSAAELVEATTIMNHHQFRAITDGEFVRDELFTDIASGAFGKRLEENNVQILIGECADEHFVYGMYRRPRPSFNGLATRFEADYPKIVVKAMMKQYFPGQTLPAKWKDWIQAFGWIYAKMQIHVSERGLIEGLAKGGAGDLIHRYRIEWRAECADLSSPRLFGATHGADMPIWFYGDGKDLTAAEQKIVRRAFLNDLAKFIRGIPMEWGAKGPRKVRLLKADGTIDITTDPQWAEALDDWQAIGAGITGLKKSRL